MLNNATCIGCKIDGLRYKKSPVKDEIGKRIAVCVMGYPNLMKGDIPVPLFDCHNWAKIKEDK